MKKEAEAEVAARSSKKVARGGCQAVLAIVQERELQDAVAAAAAQLRRQQSRQSQSHGIDEPATATTAVAARVVARASRSTTSRSTSESRIDIDKKEDRSETRDDVGDDDDDGDQRHFLRRRHYSRERREKVRRCREDEDEDEGETETDLESEKEFIEFGHESSGHSTLLTETDCPAHDDSSNLKSRIKEADGQQQHRRLSGAQNDSKLASKDKVEVAAADIAAGVRGSGESKNKSEKKNRRHQSGKEEDSAIKIESKTHNEDKEDEEPETTKRTRQRRGLLEALLGERGKSWFEQKTVILDIQNGKKQQRHRSQEDFASSDKNENKNDNNQAETFNKLEESGDNNSEKQEQSSISQRNDESSSSHKKLPTFGSVPQRLKRLPYFTYHHGQLRKNSLDLTSAATTAAANSKGRQRAQTTQVERYKALTGAGRQQQKSGSVASLGSRASSQVSQGSPTSSATPSVSSPVSGGARRSPLSQVNTSSSSISQLARRASQLGFSNLSNLFPGEPTNVRLPRRFAQQTSLIINGQEQQRVQKPAKQKQLQEQHQQQHQQRDDGAIRNKPASSLDSQRPSEQQQQQQQQQQRRQISGNRQPQQVALSERRKSHFSALSPMTRRNSFSSLQQQQQQQQLKQQRPHSSVGGAARTSFGSQNSLTQQQQQQQKQQQQRQMATLRRQQQLAAAAAAAGGPASAKFRGRPVSAAGSYLGGAHHQRSPSTSSLHHHQQHNSYRLGSAGMSPLVDPDCPVHGDSPDQPAGPQQQHVGRRRDYNSFGEHRQQPANYSLSQPDLLYGGQRGAADRDDLYDPYNKPSQYPIYDSAYQHLNSGGGGGGGTQKANEYSPVSPTNQHQSRYSYSSPTGGAGGIKHHQAPQQAPPPPSAGANGQHQAPAYYDGSSRFSLYHPAATMSEGGGGGPAGQTRLSLAPPGEQLRRIIGYKPPSVPRPVHLHPQWAYSRPFIHLKPAGSGFGRSPTPPHDAFDSDGDLDQFMDGYDADTPKFAPFNRLQDNQAVRAVDFHPSGEVYAIGSNSRALRICAYPAEHELRHFDPFDPQNQQQQQQPKAPRVLFKFLQVHRGSIYCVSFNPSGQLLATGSNDQTVHIVKYNSITHNPDGEEFRLTMHNGTIRDLCFIDDSSGNGSSLLLSAGGGDNKIYVTDCDTITPFQSMAGHTQMVMALSHCGGAQFVSGSYDKTIRFWDLRSRSCTSIVSAPPSSPAVALASERSHAHLPSGPGAPVCALRVDPSGRLLASGHTDSTCMLYDIRGAKIIQTFKPHDDEIRAISFSPKSYYLLTGGYDGRLVVSDLQGDLTQPLPSACVAESQDKIVQAKWHPADFTFVSTSADKSATLWSLPGEIRN